MIKNLIDEIDSYAQEISEDKNLPESTATVQQNVAKFSQIYKPQLQNDIEAIQNFVQQYETVKPDLNYWLSAWKTGDLSAPSEIRAILNQLSTTLKNVIQTNDQVFSSISDYRNSILEEQQILNGNANKLNSQLATLKNRLKSKNSERARIIRRQRILTFTLGPFGRLSGQLGNLIVRKKTVEKDIRDLTRQSNGLSTQVFQTNRALQVIQQLSSVINTLVNSLQNLVNSLTFTDEYMEQTIQSLQSANEANIQVVVEAYLNTIEEQITLFSQS